MTHLDKKSLSQLQNDSDMIDETNGRMSIRQYNKLKKDWNLNPGFDNAIRVAILEGNKQAEISRKFISEIEDRWLVRNGFNLEIEGDRGYVRI